MTAVRWRAAALAFSGLLGLVLGLWVLDWWVLRTNGGELHANLRRIEACRGARCTGGAVSGLFSTWVLYGGSLLGLSTLVIGALQLGGVGLGPRLIRGQILLGLLVLAGAGTLLAIAPSGLGGAGLASGGWVALVSTILCIAAGVALVRGDDPLGEGVLYQPVKVDVSPEVMDANAKYAGATIPPFAMAQRRPTTGPPMKLVTAAAAAQPGATTPPWQPAIREQTHTEAPAPRRKGTRAPFTAPPPFDAARQALRFVVAEARLADDSIAVTLEDHRKLVIEWKQFNRAAARQLPPGLPFDKLIVVDLCTVGGAPLRFLPSSRVNYADLPGGAAPNSRENLRRLVAHVKTKQPTFGLEHDSAEFFAGGREPPGLATLKQFVSYDEQYTGVIGAIPAPL